MVLKMEDKELKKRILRRYPEEGDDDENDPIVMGDEKGTVGMLMVSFEADVSSFHGNLF